MSTTERVIDDLNVAKHILCNPQMLTPEMCVRIGQAITSAIELLKEQEPIKPYIDSFNNDWWWATGCCGTPINFKTDKFCPKCGRPIKWDE